MSEAAVAESVTIAAVSERVGLARVFVAGVLGESHPCSDPAVLLASKQGAGDQQRAARRSRAGW